MKKRLIKALVGALTVSALFVGCGDKTVETEPQETVEETSEEETEAVDEVVEEETEEESDEESEETLEYYLSQPMAQAALMGELNAVKEQYKENYNDITVTTEGNHITYTYELAEGLTLDESALNADDILEAQDESAEELSESSGIAAEDITITWIYTEYGGEEICQFTNNEE